MKLIVSLLLILSSINLSFAQQQPQNDIAKLGPFAIGYEFCQKIQSIAPILQAYSSVQWPVIGAPGMTFGIVQNESAVLKICDYLTQLQSLNTEGAIFHSARFLNELTGKKWDSHLAQADLTWNVANSLYDLRGNGKARKGALASAQTHKQMVEFADKTAKYYQTQFPDANRRGPPEGIEEKHERRAKLEKIAQLSNTRSILKEASACPAPEGKTDYQKKFVTEVIPEQENIKRMEERVQFYYQTMLRMGPDFMVEIDEMQKYRNDLENLIDNGFQYKVTPGSTTVTRKVATGKVKKVDTSVSPTGTQPEVKDEVTKRDYQKIRAIPNMQLWNEFRTKYVKAWEQYINSQFLSTGTFGLFDGKKGHIESKYRSYAFECSEQQVALTLPVQDRNDARYYPFLQEAQEKCKERLTVREQEFKNIMDRYVALMQNDLQSAKSSQARIWTFESLYLGTMPIEENSTNVATNKAQSERQLKNIQAPETDCRGEFTPAEMAKLDIELQNVELALNEEIVKQNSERNTREEIRLESQKKSTDLLNQQTEKELNKANSKSKPGLVPLEMKGNEGV